MKTEITSKLTRRNFIGKSSVGAGLLLGAPSIIKASTAAAPSDEIRIGFIGCGLQQGVLYDSIVNIPGVRPVAVCDIMQNRRRAAFGRIRSRYGNEPNRYIDAAEMLEKEQGNMEAVFVSSPDFWHAPHTIMALEAGYDVYCEKMMSHDINEAREMVAAMDRTGKLCQIGHQRRSNPRYRYVLNELMHRHNVFGPIINMNGQWNRALSSSQPISVRPTLLPDGETLRRYGFDGGAEKNLSEDELRYRFLNWRFYKALSGGPISDLGAHQIDIFNWFMGTKPKSVKASGGRGYFHDREHFDSVMCLFDFDTPEGTRRAFYQVLTTTSAGGGYFESFMGTQGTLEISEREAYTNIWKEGAADNDAIWDEMVARGFLIKQASGMAAGGSDAIASYESAPPDQYALPGGLDKPPHQPHIENFFNAMRGTDKLTCDARHALESEAPIFWVNPAAESQETIHFTEEHLRT